MVHIGTGPVVLLAWWLQIDRWVALPAAALVTVAGTPELVAETPDEYVRLAAELSRSPERLEHYRNNFRAMSVKHGLSDAAGFARKLEQAFIGMVEELDRPENAAIFPATTREVN